MSRGELAPVKVSLGCCGRTRALDKCVLVGCSGVPIGRLLGDDIQGHDYELEGHLSGCNVILNTLPVAVVMSREISTAQLLSHCLYVHGSSFTRFFPEEGEV